MGFEEVDATVTRSKKFMYGYDPTDWVCGLYIALFSISTIIHIGQTVRYRLWWLFATPVVCGLLEIIGWSGRLWSSKNPYLLSPYIMQMTTTIIAPTPLIAANFVVLGEMIRRLGPCYSRLSAKMYTIVFVSCDVVALVIQAVGGAEAATAVEAVKSPNAGGHVMLAGIVFQLASISFYMLLAAEFLLRRMYNKPVRIAGGATAKHTMDRNLKLMVVGLYVSSFFIFVRSVYRTIELADGWYGIIIHTQAYFNVFDGGMITIAMYTLNVFHPGYLLGAGRTWGASSDSAEKENMETEAKGGSDVSSV